MILKITVNGWLWEWHSKPYPLADKSIWGNGDEERVNRAGKARANSSMCRHDRSQNISVSRIALGNSHHQNLYLISRYFVNFNAFYHRPTVKLSADVNNEQTEIDKEFVWIKFGWQNWWELFANWKRNFLLEERDLAGCFCFSSAPASAGCFYDLIVLVHLSTYFLIHPINPIVNVLHVCVQWN